MMKKLLNASTRALCLALGLTLMSWGSAAQAATVTFIGALDDVPEDLELFGVVSGLPFELEWDTDTGALSTFLIMELNGTVDSITASGGTWTMNATLAILDEFGIGGLPGAFVYEPMTMVITGAGLPDGSTLPYFDSITSGVTTVSLANLLPGSGWIVTTTIEDIQGLPPIVPEPGTTALMLLGLSGLAVARRRGNA